MPNLIFLTGAPASGKSTLARRLVAERPLALLLDLDTLRGQLGDWRADPASAGVRAREIGLAIARAQLAAGGDVVVPQFVRRPELVEQFRELASLTGSRFRLVALVSGAAEAAARFAGRAGSADPNHADAEFLQSAPGAPTVEELYADMLAMLARFGETRYVEVIPGDVEGTLAELRRALA